MDRITGHTELLTLMAYPIRHSSSPAMHNEALSYLGLDYAYLCFEVDQDNLPQAIESMRALKVRGGNISMPNKIAVMQYLDRLTPEAELCGAVNTIINDDGVLTGHITDGIGYIRGLQDHGFDIKGKKMTIVGAGGAAKAIQVQAALAGIREMLIFNIHDKYWPRVRETTALLNERLGCQTKLYGLEDLDALKREIWDSDLLANATALGMTPQMEGTYIPDGSYFKPGLLVTDVIYAPPQTLFLKMAREAGCDTMNGFPMMLFQGAEAFRLWTGQDMPIAHMKEFLKI
ncbi:MAG: shikimate dehydrogenase [Lachnospiraceae bacterium]|nr:shikimate dehydrogenase [Lachnospiraceae bacterium]